MSKAFENAWETLRNKDGYQLCRYTAEATWEVAQADLASRVRERVMKKFETYGDDWDKADIQVRDVLRILDEEGGRE